MSLFSNSLSSSVACIQILFPLAKVICFLAIDVCRLIYCSGIQNFIVNTSLYCQNTLSMHSNFWIGIDMNWHAAMTIYIMYAYKITENVTE